MTQHTPTLMAPPTSMQHHRFGMLDALRGLAAVLIACRHTPYSLGRGVSYPNNFMAVDFFFCLSGFVVAFAYEQRLQQKLTVRQFFIARLLRLYPLYLLGTVLGMGTFIGNTLLPPHSHTVHTHISADRLAYSLVLPLFFLPVFFFGSPKEDPSIFPTNPPGWSLFFEILSNIAYALLLRARLAASWLLGAIAAFSFALLALYMHRHQTNLNLGYSTPTFICGFARVGLSFFLGVLLLRLYRRKKLNHLYGWNALAAVIVILFVLIGTLVSRSDFMSRGIVQLLVVTFLYPLMVLLGATVHVEPTWKRVCEFLGSFSYPLYALHFSAMFLLYIVVFVFKREHWSTQGAAQLIAPAFVLLLLPVTSKIGQTYDPWMRGVLGRWLMPEPVQAPKK